MSKSRISTSWAWWDNETKSYKFVYPKKICVEICSPDFFKGAIQRGEGELIEVVIVEKD